MARITVDSDICIQCGECTEVCPGGFLELGTDGLPKPGVWWEQECISCGHCVAVCPTGSISHSAVPVEQCSPLPENLEANLDQLEPFFKGRRSIRVYQDKPVPREVLTRLLDIARVAPTGHNVQPLEWLVIDNRDVIRNFSRIAVDWMHWVLENNPELSKFLSMERLVKRQEAGQDEFLRDTPVLVVAHAHKRHVRTATPVSHIGLTYFYLAAGAVGLGCCWAGMFKDAAIDYPPLREALALPEGHKPYACLMVGYPVHTYRRLPARKPLEITWR